MKNGRNHRARDSWKHADGRAPGTAWEMALQEKAADQVFHLLSCLTSPDTPGSIAERLIAIECSEGKEVRRSTMSCTKHEHHTHTHAPGCGHIALKHDGHTDYLHDGHLHHMHGDH